MFYIIILFILAIWFLPSLIMVLAGFYTAFEMIVLDGLTDPDLWIIIFSLIAGIWFIGAWGKAGMKGKHGRKKKTG